MRMTPPQAATTTLNSKLLTQNCPFERCVSYIQRPSNVLFGMCRGQEPVVRRVQIDAALRARGGEDPAELEVAIILERHERKRRRPREGHLEAVAARLLLEAAAEHRADVAHVID